VRVSSDWNEEFTKLVRQGFGAGDAEPAQEAIQPAGEPAETRALSDPSAALPNSDSDSNSDSDADSDSDSDSDSDLAYAARRSGIAAGLVRLGFLPADRATPTNPAVAVLTELLPPEAEVKLCLTCHEFSCSGPHEFASTTGRFPDVATVLRGGGRYQPVRTLVKGPRRDLVVCTQDALCWTQSQAYGAGEDSVTLFSVPFSEVLGATVRNVHKGEVEVYVDEGPTMSFRVERDEADVLQSQVDQAAQSE